MRENGLRSFPAVAAVVLLLAAGPAPPAVAAVDSAPPAGSPPGVAAWLDGDAAQAALDLAARKDREGVLNRAVALLYAGDGTAAERELVSLRAREPRWTPALRWLARARAEAGSPALEETLQALLADRGADSRDFLWVGRLRLDGGEAERARASLREAVAREKDLYLGWLWLGDAEDALGRAVPAREAWLRARELHAGGDVLVRLGERSLRAGRGDEGRAWLQEALATPEGRRREEEIRRLVPGLVAPPAAFVPAPPLRPGEKLSYSAKYLFFGFATVEIENEGFSELHGRRVARVVF
jgi:tetratricopeptide (TPR) repeat protein